MTITEEANLTCLQARMHAALTSKLDAHLRRLGWDADRLAAHQLDCLRALLAHAMEHSPFHARRLAHVDPSRFGLADLSTLPTMTKAEMMTSYDDVVTDRRLCRALVEDHLRASHHQPSLLLGQYVCLASGGSSGQRGAFAQTIDEYADNLASILRGAVAQHAASGAPDGLLAGMVGAGAPVHSTGFVAATVRGLPIRIMPAPVTLPLAETVERLNVLQPSVLVGYPSGLAQLADEQRAGRLGISPLTVVSTSEMLTDSLRSAITAGFSAPIVNTFASTEGLVAHSEPDGKELAFATDMSIIELVDAYGDPVPPGTPSACGLVTNLHNFTQPLIRYELSDSLTACPAGTARGDLRATVNGRDDATFSYGDAVVHPLTIRTVMTGCAAVNEYQVRQTERGVDVLIVTGDQVDRRRLTRAVAASLREAGLPDPAVDVRIVGSLERHPETGKTRRFIPLGSPTRP